MTPVKTDTDTPVPSKTATDTSGGEADPPGSGDGVARDLAFEVLAAVVTALIGTMLGFTAFGGMFSDLYMTMAGPSDVPDEITIVAIDRETLHLWNPEDADPDVTPRAMLGELVSSLHANGARTIVLDVLLDTSQPGDARLAEAARAHGAVVGAERVEVNLPSRSTSFAAGITPELGMAQSDDVPVAVHPAHANLYLEEPVLFTGQLIARGVPLLQQHTRSSLRGTWPMNVLGAAPGVAATTPSLSLAGAWLHTARGENPAATISDLQTELELKCTSTTSDDLCNIENVAPLLPLSASLYEPFRLNYFGSEPQVPISTLSAAPLLKASATRAAMATMGVPSDQLPSVQLSDELATLVRDKLVIIGRVDRVGQDNADRHATPYSFPLFSDKDMAGVRIQAQLMAALLAGRQLTPIAPWVEWLLGLGAIALGIGVFRRFSAMAQLPIWGLGSVAMVGLGYALFVTTGGVVLELGVPISAFVITLAAMHIRALIHEG